MYAWFLTWKGVHWGEGRTKRKSLKTTRKQKEKENCLKYVSNWIWHFSLDALMLSFSFSPFFSCSFCFQFSFSLFPLSCHFPRCVPCLLLCSVPRWLYLSVFFVRYRNCSRCLQFVFLLHQYRSSLLHFLGHIRFPPTISSTDSLSSLPPKKNPSISSYRQ